MKTSKQLFQQKLRKPINWNSISTKEAIEKAGFIEFLDAGFPYFSPIGQKIKINLEKLLKDTCQKYGFEMIKLPSLHKRELVEKSGKYAKFKKEFVTVAKNYVLTSTSEEYFLELAKAGLESYAQLPIKLFEIGNAIRFIQRPQGILKLREFSGAVLITFERSDADYELSLSLFKNIMQEVLEKLKISYRVSSKNEGIEYFYDSSDLKRRSPLSIAMGYRYNPNPNEMVMFRTSNNSLSPVILGTFGIGIERLFYAACDACRDEKGFRFPDAIRPYDKAIILIDPKDSLQIAMGEKIYNAERNKNVGVYLEDRDKMTLKEKLDYADFLGVIEKLIIGKREVKSGPFN